MCQREEIEEVKNERSLREDWIRDWSIYLLSCDCVTVVFIDFDGSAAI